MADNNILIKITSEADLTAAQKQLQELTKQSEEYEKQILDLKDAEKADAASIKALGLSEEHLAKRLKENRDYYRQEVKYKKEDIAETKKSIKALSDQVNSYKTLNGTMGKAAQQLRAMREELMRMEDAGEYGTQAFVELAIRASELEDQMGDLQQRIRILASDTKNMDAIMGLGDGLAGTFYIATSAAELLGDDVEGLQKAFYKVQAAMSIVSGTQQVYNALSKDSAAMVVLNTAVTKLFNKSKVEQAASTSLATKAQLALNAAFKANPIGVILAGVVALAAAGYALYKLFDKGERAARRAREAQKEYDKINKVSTYNLNIYAKEHEKAMQKIEKEEDDRLYEAKKRHASDVEMSEIELDILKKKQKQELEYTNKAIKDNNDAQIAANKVYTERQNQLKNTRKGTKAYYEALELLNDAERQMHDVWERGNALVQERQNAENAVREKELEIAEQRRQLVVQEQQTRLDMMREGQGKEITQIKANLKEQLRQYSGHSKEEIAMRKALKEKAAQEIADVERKYTIQEQQTLTEIEVKAAEERTKKLTGAEGVEKQIQVWDDYYAQRKYQIKENARLEAEEVQRSTDSEEVKDAKLKKIKQQAQADITALEKEGAEKRIEIRGQEVDALQLAADKAAYAAEHAQGPAKLDALKANLDAQLALYDAQEEELEQLWHNGDEQALISKKEYEKRKWEITKANADARTQYELDKMQEIANGMQTALGYMQQISDLAFEAIQNNIQAEMDALDEEYTTDWEEAQKNADKKYITEKEYEKKKAALEEKQAKYAKAQALINAAINTALGITQTLASTPWPLNFVMAAITAAMGAAQIAVIASKPLAQYAKGRKGGKGEYALVGEKGPEIMYVPQGASIVPNNKLASPDDWGQYGVPRLSIPDIPHTDVDILRYAAEQTSFGVNFDYDRMGASVAQHMPKQQAVTVNVDRSGVHVSHGGDHHTYLNVKYTGTWQR